MDRMKNWTAASIRTLVCLGLIFVAIGGASITAQTTNPLDQILVKLDQIIAALTPPTTVKMATSTSHLTFAYTVWCSVANSGSVPLQNVRIAFVGTDGAVVQEVVGASLAAGRTLEHLFVGPPISNRSRCEFTYTGPASAGRANMHVISGELMFVYEAR